MSQRSLKLSYWQDAPMPREQLVLFPTHLEEMIPADHPVRLLDEILDRLDWTKWEAVYHGRRGQPPIHPSVLAKVILFSMIRRVRSSRQIEYQLKHSIDFIWLTSGRVIDHTTLSEFRRKHQAELKDIFKQMVKLAINLGISKLSELCIDGTRVLANASRYSTWTTERLQKVMELLDAQISQALESLNITDQTEDELFGAEVTADKLPSDLRDLKERREKLASVMNAVQEMDEARQKSRIKGAAQIPKTDSDARILPNKEGGFAANYTPMVTTETHGGLIVHSHVVIGNVEHDQVISIVDCVVSDLEVEIECLLMDAAYTTGKNLTEVEQRNIEIVGPLAEKQSPNNPAVRENLNERVAEDRVSDLPINPQTKRLDKSAFIRNEEEDSYYCPAGRCLPYVSTTNTTTSQGTPVQRRTFRCPDCSGCELVQLCLKTKDQEKKRGRTVVDDEHEPARRRHRERMKTDEAKAGCARRQHLGEQPFALIKEQFGLRRFLLRGIEGVNQEWLWATTSHNLLKLIKRGDTLRALLAASNQNS